MTTQEVLTFGVIDLIGGTAHPSLGNAPERRHPGHCVGLSANLLEQARFEVLHPGSSVPDPDLRD